MIIVFEPKASKKQITNVVERVKEMGLKPTVSKGTHRTIIGVIGPEDAIRTQHIEVLPGVEKVMSILKPYRLVSREAHEKPSVIRVKGVRIGGKKLVVMGGPCTVESRDVLMKMAKIVKDAGAEVLRGGAFKPRSSPYAFQGMGEEGLKLLREAADRYGLVVVSEIVDVRDLPAFEHYVDILQIGARNMQNFELLKAVGQLQKPVLLKRGLAATVNEFLLAAEYIASQGNSNIILCERGIRTFETATRFTLDINAIPVVKKLSHLPIVVDPSHSTGNWEYVEAVAKAGIAAGADGLIIEAHPRPEEAVCDGPQSLLPRTFVSLMKSVSKVARAVGRTL